MADDREVLRAIWDGKIAVRFSLDRKEVHTTDQPEPFYLLVPRQSYFPLVTDKVQKHFSRYIDSENSSEMWLEDEGQPLRWHIPIGVLFDIFGSEASLPWNITVHFQNFPESDLIHCNNLSAVESHFMSSVKEADCLKHRSQVINAMQKRDHRQLWTGLQNDHFDKFWDVNRKLMEHAGDELFKFIPFRVYQGDKPFIQRLIRPVTDTGDLNTLQDLLNQHLPEVFESESGKSHYRAVIQGIDPPLETPLQWLSEHFSHPDNFLHICVVPIS